MKLKAVSLFSSSGIGDIALRKLGFNVVLANELIESRANLFSENYPNTYMFKGDIWKLQDEMINFYKKKYSDDPFVILATPPCQGMSANGMGKMLSEYRKGLREKFDPRNQLIIPTMKVIKALQPEWVILENVPNMQNTIILDENGKPKNIIEYIFETLNDYVGESKVINFSSYGVAQDRKRLITILTKSNVGKTAFKKLGTFIPSPEYGQNSLFLKQTKTLRDVIGDVPPLDASEDKNIRDDIHPLHKVPIMDKKKYTWVKYTKEGDSAFNNQCINPSCLFQNNKLHGTKITDNINQAKKNTPLYCEKCGQLLPRPSVIDSKSKEARIMSGFTSAYKRMSWDKPSPTLTKNLMYVSSDNKIHPSQNRTLSLYEALKIQTILDYNYSFKINGKYVNNQLIAESIGESVPPKIIEVLLESIIKISKNN